MHNTWTALRCWSAWAGFSLLTAACGGESAEKNAPSMQEDAGGSGGADAAFTEPDASAAGSSGASGAGGEPAAPDRGDPASFPTACVPSCEEACTRLVSCGGPDSTAFPLDEQSCRARCDVGSFGSSSQAGVVFKCCVAQDACEDVKECGGWLAHPDTVEPCGRYCECRRTSSMNSLTKGRQAPEGYRFAPDVLMLEPQASAASLMLPPGVKLLENAARKLVRLDCEATAATLDALRASARILPTLVDAAGRISAASGDVVLVADSPVALATAIAQAAKFGLGQPRALRTRLRQHPDATLTLLRGSDPWRTLDAVAALSSIPGVHAELDQWRRYVKRYAPNDPGYPNQWHLHNTGQHGATAGVDGRVTEAWDVTMGDPQVIIAINDDGVDLDHPEFAGRLEPELNYPADWKTSMASGDFGDHGTSVAGVAAAAADNAQGGAGVCPGCSILGHLLGESSYQGFQITDAAVAQGFSAMVDAGAWVINNSWGLDMGDPIYADAVGPVPGLSSVVKAAFDYAEISGRGGLGTVVVFAAGNSNARLDPYTTYDTIVAVSAVDDLGLKPYYSSFGPDVDIAAPSNGGINGITAAAANSQYTDDFGGTSSASPFVAGVVGLILSVNPTFSARQVREVLAISATKIDPVFGGWDAQGHSDFHGAGLVNAFAAVQFAAGRCASADTCMAPSDECGATCATGTQCSLCRTHADCAEGYRCQALPSLGALVCVAAKGSEDCPAATRAVNGYCLPTPDTCGFCDGPEVCNGRDDDCNGQVDDGSVCRGGPVCFIDGPGCGAGLACAGQSCTQSCTTDSDCSNATCEKLTNQYGAQTGEMACMQSHSGGSFDCPTRCEVRASGLDDEHLDAFTSCVQDNTEDCSAVVDCRDLLRPPPTN